MLTPHCCGDCCFSEVRGGVFWGMLGDCGSAPTMTVGRAADLCAVTFYMITSTMAGLVF